MFFNLLPAAFAARLALRSRAMMPSETQSNVIILSEETHRGIKKKKKKKERKRERLRTAQLHTSTLRQGPYSCNMASTPSVQCFGKKKTGMKLSERFSF